MIKVNNKRTIYAIAKGAFKANKMRNIFAVIAIVLTSILFVTIFTMSSSLIKSMEESTMRQVGGSSHGGFKYLTEEQYEKLKGHASIKTISYSVVLGTAENKALATRPTEIRYTSGKENAEGMFSIPTTGRLPEKEDEIATDTLVLERLGIPAEIGQKVSLEYSVSGEKKEETFTLVGFWTGDQLMRASQAWLSPNYVKKELKGYIPSDEYDFIGKINADVNFSNTIGIEKKLIKVIEDSGFAVQEINYGVNWAYMGNSEPIDIGDKVGILLAVGIIMICGYLMISNVFHISVAKDIREYGLLKTVGTTEKQIRVMIRKQAGVLCAIGIPIGLIAGYMVGIWMTPIALSILNTNTIQISHSPLIFILSTIFSMITVWLSILKPTKIAGRVSPIEALRSADVSYGGRIQRKSRKIKLSRMAFYNVFRNRKKASLVTISLSLSLIIFNATYSIANGFDMDKYVSNMIGSDFAVADVSYFNVYLNYYDQDTLSENFLDRLSSLDSVHSIHRIYFHDALGAMDARFSRLPKEIEAKLKIERQRLEDLKQGLDREDMLFHIYGLNEDGFSRLNLLEGEIDLEKLKTGNYVVVSPYDREGTVNYYEIGDTVSLPGKDGDVRAYEVMAIATIPYNISVRHSHSITPEFFMPQDGFLQDIKNKAPMMVTINAKDDGVSEIEDFISQYIQEVDQSLHYESKASIAVEYESAQRTFKTVGIVLSILVGFLGIMNFINTTVTSIFARKREIAMLQSVGMTKRQTKKMLVLEGVVYTLMTAVFTLTFGTTIGFIIIKGITGGSDYINNAFTVLPSILCLPILILISALVPAICQRRVYKQSIVERLREVD